MEVILWVFYAYSVICVAVGLFGIAFPLKEKS